jgi:hypothetical protein
MPVIRRYIMRVVLRVVIEYVLVLWSGPQGLRVVSDRKRTKAPDHIEMARFQAPSCLRHLGGQRVQRLRRQSRLLRTLLR